MFPCFLSIFLLFAFLYLISNPWLEEFWQWKFNCSLLQKDLPHKNRCTGANDHDAEDLDVDDDADDDAVDNGNEMIIMQMMLMPIMMLIMMPMKLVSTTRL